MTNTVRAAGARLLTAVLTAVLAAVLGAAFAAGYGYAGSSSTTGASAPAGSGLVAKALARTRVTLFAAAPGTKGATKIVSAPASKFVDGSVTTDIGNARFAMVSIRRSGAGLRRPDAVFAVASGSSAKNLELAVAGVPGAKGQDTASLSAVATYLYDAVHGTEPAVLLERGRGVGAVAFAVYDPAMPAPGLSVSGADEVLSIVNGRVRTYRVQASGSSVRKLVIASGKHKGQQLSAVIG